MFLKVLAMHDFLERMFAKIQRVHAAGNFLKHFIRLKLHRALTPFVDAQKATGPNEAAGAQIEFFVDLSLAADLLMAKFFFNVIRNLWPWVEVLFGTALSPRQFIVNHLFNKFRTHRMFNFLGVAFDFGLLVIAIFLVEKLRIGWHFEKVSEIALF